MKRRFEDDLNELEDIAKKLENGSLELDEALSLYEKGMKMARECEKRLSDAETTVKIIAANEKGGGE